MAQARDFLERFRPAGAPGAAGQAGVPADRAREQADELGPVLALLDDAQAECERIVERARQEADRIAAAALAEAAAIREEAAQRAGTAREESARQTLAQEEARNHAPVAAARREAASIARRARARMPGLAAQAVDWVRAGPVPMGDSAGDGPAPSDRCQRADAEPGPGGQPPGRPHGSGGAGSGGAGSESAGRSRRAGGGPGAEGP